MPKLNEIIDKHSEEITSYCTAFGFNNVRIYCDLNNAVLQLVVSYNENCNHYQTALEAILTEMLKCQVIVMVESKLKAYLKSSILKKSASLNNRDDLENTFTKKLDQIHIDPFLEVEKDKNFQRALDLANRILKTIPLADNQHNSFFAKSVKSDSTGNNQTNLMRTTGDNVIESNQPPKEKSNRKP